MPAIERSDPPYLQIAGHIRNMIIAGELKDGDAIPSARQIMREWEVAVATVTKVLATLKSEGIVRTVPGVGTVVNRKDAHPYAGDRSGDDEPIATSVSWFDGTLSATAPLLVQTERIPSGTFAYVAEQTGRTLEGEFSQLAATAADAVVAERLGVPVGSPVLISRSRFVDAEGDVIEYGESTSRPDTWVFVDSSTAKG